MGKEIIKKVIDKYDISGELVQHPFLRDYNPDDPFEREMLTPRGRLHFYAFLVKNRDESQSAIGQQRLILLEIGVSE